MTIALISNIPSSNHREHRSEKQEDGAHDPCHCDLLWRSIEVQERSGAVKQKLVSQLHFLSYTENLNQEGGNS